MSLADGDEITRSNGDGEITLWDSEIAFTAGGPIDGIAFGDADPNHDGIEAVTTSRDSGVYLTKYNNATEEWETSEIWTSGGQQLTPAIGDLRTDIDGNEILVVGLSSGSEDVDPGNGTATVLSWDGSSWNAERVFETGKLIHGCAIGDLDPTIEGNEGVITTFGHETYQIWYDHDKSEWNSSLIHNDTGNVRKAVIADVNPDHPGNEVVTVSKGGRVNVAYGNHTGNATVSNWTNKVIWEGDALARVCVGDIDPDPGLEIYAGSDTFKVFGFKRQEDGNWTAQEIFEDTDKFRGVWVGDVDPNIDGPELYAYGYSTRCTQIYGSFATGWNTRTIFEDVARSHGIRIGDLKSDNPGLEIGLVGYSESLTLVYPSDWGAEIAFQGTAAIDGLAIGEVDADHEGVEIVSSDRNNEVRITKYLSGSDSYSSEAIWTAGGQQLTPAIGDLRTDIPGNEIMVVGLSSGTEDVNPGDGTATVLNYDGSSWNAERAFTEENYLIHGCDIGDLDPNIEGLEAVAVTFGWNAYLIWYDYEAEEWKNDLIYHDNGNVRKVVIADLIDDHPGNEMVTVSKGGNVTIAYGTVGNWTTEVVYSGDALARVCVGDVDPDPGLEIYSGSDTFKVFAHKYDGTEWVTQEVFEDTDKFRGVWVGDVDPDIEGPELYAYGYSRKLTKITGSFATGWNSETVYIDTARGHEIRIGEVIPDNVGPEIAIVGYSQAITVISVEESGETLVPNVAGPEEIAVTSGGSNTGTYTISGDGFISVDYNDIEGLDIDIYPRTHMFRGEFEVTVTAHPTNEDKTETLVLTIGGVTGNVQKDVTITITGDKEAPSKDTVKLGDGTDYSQGMEVDPTDNLTFKLTEDVTEESFQDALTAGTIKAEANGETLEGVVFELTGSNELFVDLNNATQGKQVNITIAGLKDAAGNEIESTTLVLQVRSQTTPQPDEDTDDDGMDDDWEEKYGLDKNDPSDAAGDLDGDGHTNLEEFEMETDPTDENDPEEEDDEDYTLYIIIGVIVLVVLIFLVIIAFSRKGKEEEAPYLPEE